MGAKVLMNKQMDRIGVWDNDNLVARCSQTPTAVVASKSPYLILMQSFHGLVAGWDSPKRILWKRVKDDAVFDDGAKLQTGGSTSEPM